MIEIIELNIDPYVNLIFDENYNLNDKNVFRGSDIRFTKIATSKINPSLVYSMFKITQFCYSILGFSCQQNNKLQE